MGRETLIEEFLEAIDDGPGSPGRATLYTGARGSDKTVLLNAVEDAARTRGWLVVSETATDGFVGRIVHQHLPRLLADFDPGAIKQRLTGVAAPMGIGSVTWSSLERHVVEAGLRSQIELLTDLLAEHETGHLITLDEVHRQQLPELRELATTIQHAFRENREVAFEELAFRGLWRTLLTTKSSPSCGALNDTTLAESPTPMWRERCTTQLWPTGATSEKTHLKRWWAARTATPF